MTATYACNICAAPLSEFDAEDGYCYGCGQRFCTACDTEGPLPRGHKPADHTYGGDES